MAITPKKRNYKPSK